ncbi:MAG TPA: substrate-binding domain-containing protein [Opitutaceae bacterium]|nr:substrate-binding domain-containing protein [Opitutaceae bacterium]
MFLEFPKRVSLAFQIAESIRSGINQHLWKDCLPAERRLAQLFKVSRPTVSQAVQLLVKEGVVTARQGCRTKIVQTIKETPPSVSPLVAIVTHTPLELMSSSSSNSIGEMRAHLAKQGFLTEVFVCQGRGAAAQLRSLESFLRQTQVFGCVLLSLRQELQQWFQTHPIPALVLGSCHATVRLPSFDVDYQATCRHAFGVFAAKGHRRVALVLPDSGGAGELASERGFLEAAAKHPDSQPVVMRHDGTAKSLGFQLDRLFNSQSPPTALLVAKELPVLMVVFYLLKRGLAVPDRVSLIARDYDKVFVSVSPAIAHYRISEETYNNRLSRLMLALVHHDALPNRSHFIIPQFVAGGTVKSITPN